MEAATPALMTMVAVTDASSAPHLYQLMPVTLLYRGNQRRNKTRS